MEGHAYRISKCLKNWIRPKRRYLKDLWGAGQGKGKRKSKQWTLGGLYFANIERYSALLVNVRKIFVTIFVDRPMLVKQNSTFSGMSVSFFGTVRRPFTKLGISQETSRDLPHSSLTSLRLSRRCHLSWTNTVSWGNNPADFKDVLKSKDVSFLLGKLVTSSNRSFGYPSFWTIRTRSCQTENKIFNERMYFFRSLCKKTASFVKYMQECFAIKRGKVKLFIVFALRTVFLNKDVLLDEWQW